MFVNIRVNEVHTSECMIIMSIQLLFLSFVKLFTWKKKKRESNCTKILDISRNWYPTSDLIRSHIKVSILTWPCFGSPVITLHIAMAMPGRKDAKATLALLELGFVCHPSPVDRVERILVILSLSSQPKVPILFFFGDWTRLHYFVVLLWWVPTPDRQWVYFTFPAHKPI